MSDIDDAAEVIGLTRLFWASLASDDNAGLVRLVKLATIELNQLRPDAIAAQLREGLRLSREDCASMVPSQTVRVTADGLYCVASLKAWRERVNPGRRMSDLADAWDAHRAALPPAWVVGPPCITPSGACGSRTRSTRPSDRRWATGRGSSRSPRRPSWRSCAALAEPRDTRMT